MTIPTQLVPGLDENVRQGGPKRRAEAARRIAELFLQGAENFRSDHVALFDGVLIDLVPHTEITARADLAERLSVLANAPRALVGQLAREDEISIAGPLLRRSPVINEQALIQIARMKGQGHLLAMSERPTLSPGITDVIVRRGDREAVRRGAGEGGGAPRGNGGVAVSAARISRADQAPQPGWRSDARGWPARRSLGSAVEGPSGRINRYSPPPAVRGGQARQAGCDQAGDERNFRRARGGREPPRLRAGAPHDPRPAQRR